MIYYVCSPYTGKTPEQVQIYFNYAVDLTREMLLYGHCPITPHLYITACLNDNDPEERRLGLEASFQLLEKCDAVIVGQRFGISGGMAAEIEKARQLRKPVFYRDHNIADFKNLTIVCDKSKGYPVTRVIQDNVELQKVTKLTFSHEGEELPVLSVEMLETETEGNQDGKQKKLSGCGDV